MSGGLATARALTVLLALLFAVASANVGDRQWTFRNYNVNSRSTKPGRAVDITLDLGVHPAWPGCFGAKYREKKSRGRFGPLIDCVSGKSNNLVIAPDGAVRVKYPKGEWGTQGGAQFYRNFSRDIGTSAILQYEVKFGERFNPTKGGKLPGLYGGNKACSGGNKAASKECFSLRVMWRRHWGGASYMYIPTQTQSEEFCRNCYVSDIAEPSCSEVVRTSESGALELAPGAAVSRDMVETKRAYCDFGRRFKLNAIPHNETYRFFFPNQGEDNHRWPVKRYIRLTQVVHLNTINKRSGWPNADGYYGLYMDGHLVHQSNNIVYRNTEKLQISGLFFSTFMGGSDPSWAPKRDMYADFRNFAIVKNNMYEIPSVSPPTVTMTSVSDKRRTYVIRVGRPIPADVDGIAFSSDVTCMASKFFVRVNRMSGDRLGVVFPRAGKYTLCLRSKYTVGNVYVPQRGAVVTVYENPVVMKASPAAIYFEGNGAESTDVELSGSVRAGDYVAFSRAGDCLDDLTEVTRVQKVNSRLVVKDVHLEQVAVYTMCYSRTGSNYRVQPGTIEVKLKEYCLEWGCDCREINRLRSHGKLTKEEKDFAAKFC